MSPRKRKLLKFGLLVGLPFLLVLGFWPRWEAPTPPITSGFLGFTNIATGPAALFAVTNYPEDATFPRVWDVARREDGTWKKMFMPAGWWPAMQLEFGGRPGLIVTLAAPVTNQPMRLVVQLRTEQRGLRAAIDRLVAKTGLRGGHPLFRPPTVYFTNETVVGGAVFESGTK